MCGNSCAGLLAQLRKSGQTLSPGCGAAARQWHRVGYLAISLARAGRCDAALVEAALALGRYRDIPEVRLDVGLVLLICGNPAAALEQFDLAVAI